MKRIRRSIMKKTLVIHQRLERVQLRSAPSRKDAGHKPYGRREADNGYDKPERRLKKVDRVPAKIARQKTNADIHKPLNRKANQKPSASSQKTHDRRLDKKE